MPGAIFPADGPRSTASEAERKLYRALAAQLPDSWRAWHSVRLWSAGYRDSEGDFVIGIPKRGLLVVEVKGGRIELTAGRWLQNGRALDTPPRQQAQGFVRALAAAIQTRGAKVPPWEVVCAFPDTEFSEGPAAGDVAGLTFGARDLAWLGKLLPELADRALAGRAPPGNDSWLATVHAIWGETWVPRVCLADRVEDSKRRMVALDEDQFAILDVAGENQRALVEGGAGTGKTLVARELLLRRARAGKRALYFCFTDALAMAVARGLEAERDAAAQAQAAPIRRYACELLSAAGHALPPPTREFWNEVSLRAACEALPSVAERPDLVVVDEAQDFEAADWMLIEALVQDRDLWAFGDSRQRFWRERVVPEPLFSGAVRLKLRHQQRNPPDLWDFALGYVEDGRPPKRPDPSALRLCVVHEKDPLDRVRHELDMLRKDGARAEDIAVLSLAGRGRSRLLEIEKLGSHRVARADAPDAPQRVIADTFLRFKGLDRPFVILTELVQGSGMRYETRMHIALTRATVGAVIVCDDAAVQGDLRLRSLL
jgi:hypothetical protein